MKRWIMMMVCLMTMGVLNTVLPGWAQGPGEEDLSTLRKQIQQLEVGQQAIREDLKAIKDLLTARAKPPSPVDDIALTLDVGDAPAKGQADAPLTLVEYTDYQCPFCARHSQTVLPQLVKNFIDTGKVRYVLRDFPLASIHPHAAKAHEAAHCAGEQGKYWELHDLLFANQKELQAEKLAGYAAAVGVADAGAFQACVDSGKYDEQTKTGVTEGTKVGVRGTPTFALGRTEANGTISAVKLIRGAQGVPAFAEQIQALLAAKTDKTAEP